MDNVVQQQAGLDNLPQLQFFPWNGRHLIFNVSTTTLYEVDQEAMELLAHLNQRSWEVECNKKRDLVQELHSAGVFSFLPPPKRSTDPPLTTLYLNASATCNLDCLYCIANQSTHIDKAKFMSREVGERSIDLLLRESGDSQVVKVVFFGGEPLLNPKLIAHLLDYGRKQSVRHNKNMHLLVATNGTLLNCRLIDLLSQENVAVQVSLDGPPQIQNHFRPTNHGEGTYDRVLQNIQALQDKGIQQLSLQTTLSALDPSPVEILEHLWNLGVGQITMQFASPTPVFSPPWSKDNLPLMKRFQQDLADYFFHHLCRGQFVPLSNVLKPLSYLSRRDRFLHRCGVGLSMIAVTPEGDIFPCSAFARDPTLAVGNVFDGLDIATLRTYGRYSVDQKDSCRTCWARYLCGGGCHYSALLVNGSLSLPEPIECALLQHQFEVAIRLFGRIKRDLPALFNAMESREVLRSLPGIYIDR